MRAALVARDFGSVFRMLGGMGYSQNMLAELIGTGQPEISNTARGRKVISLAVIERIVAGLGIPPCLIGLACGPCEKHAGFSPPAGPP
jgi:transcriptional regulator with XRE-family HTH domain